MNDEATQEEIHEVLLWLKTPEGQAYFSERMDREREEIQEGHEEEFIGRTISSEEMLERLMHQLRRQQTRRIVWRVAAILIPFILILSLFLMVNSRVDLFATSQFDEVYVPKGETLQVMFQDGSKVYLNSDSHIRYPRSFGLGSRRVELQGEGFFQVAKANGRPFIVALKQMDVRVLGTTFDVKDYPEDANFSVALETGSVELSGKQFNTFLIKPGEKAVFDRASGHYRIYRPEEVSKESIWKQRVLIFDNTSLSDAIEILGRKYDVKFNVTDKRAFNYHYTLQTNYKDLSLILDELELIAPVKFHQAKDSVVVSMK